MRQASRKGTGAAPALVVAGGAVLAGAMVVHAGALIGLLTMSVVGIGLLLLLIRICGEDESPEDRRRVLRWTLAAFVAHLLGSLAISSTGASVRFFGGDAATYHHTAGQIVDHWNGAGPMPRLPSGRDGFYYLLAGLYRVFGTHLPVGLALNATLAAGLIPVVGDSTRRLFGDRAVRYVAPLLLFLPGLFLWTSQLLKEAPILFLIAVAVNCAVRMTESIAPGRIVVFATATALLLAFRGAVGSFVAVGLVAGLILGRRQVLSGAATGAIVLATMAIVVLAGGVGESGFETVAESNLQQANNVRQGLAAGVPSGFGADVDISTSRSAVRYLPVGLVSFLLGPFPWQVDGVRQLIAVPDVLVWWWLLPSLWVGCRKSLRLIGRRSLLLVLPAVAASVVLALVISNYGTVVREREQIVVILVPLIALGLASKAVTRQAEQAQPVSVAR